MVLKAFVTGKPPVACTTILGLIFSTGCVAVLKE